MTYSFLTVVKATNAAAVKMNAAVVEMNAINVVENVSAVDALNFEAFNFFSHFKMIIQRSLTFKTLIMFFFHDS
jgi:hypothetical protein